MKESWQMVLVKPWSEGIRERMGRLEDGEKVYGIAAAQGCP